MLVLPTFCSMPYLTVLQVYQYSPTSKTSRLESGRTNKLLMRRYATMQKGRDADVFGILVGTLGVGKSFHDLGNSHLLIALAY